VTTSLGFFSRFVWNLDDDKFREMIRSIDAGQQWRNRINGKRDRNKQNKP
jgi:hypothetical protein